VRTALEWLAPVPGQRVLDLGCGRGFALALLDAFGAAPLAGVDCDATALGVARTALPQGVAIARADAARTPFRDACFERVLCSEVLEHVADDAAVLREIRRVLVPGGRVAITVPNADYPILWDPVNKLLERVAATHVRRGPLAGIWAGHLRLYGEAELRARVESAGLTVLEVRRTTRHALPFHHLLVYGIGKPLLLAGALPRGVARGVDRHAARTRTPRDVGVALRLALRVVDAVDRRNAASEPAGTPTVNLCLLARREPEIRSLADAP
jgi:SAM-dependent methyltransferase